MTHRHGNLQFWALVAFVAVAGLGLFLFIPRYEIASGAATGLIALMVVKHLGLLASFGAPLSAVARKWFHRGDVSRSE